MFEAPQRILCSIHGSLVCQHEAEQLYFVDGELRYRYLLLQVLHFFNTFYCQKRETYLWCRFKRRIVFRILNEVT